MRNETYNIDCLEYMRSLPDNAFDIAVCDPPYGKGNDESLVGRGGYFYQHHQTSPQRGGSGKGSDATTSRWNRLLGGRRERYYKPTDTPIQRWDMGNEIQNWGG